MKDKFIVVHVIPTGIGAEIGGYAGDATPVNNLIAAVSDIVITHPNVINAANFYLASKNVMYVEGYCLDQFMFGNWGLKPVLKNKIGIVIDKAGTNQLTHIINAINATISTGGVDVIGYTFTKKPIGGKVIQIDNNFSGEIDNPDTLIEAVQKLLDKGSQAIAIFSVIEDVPPKAEEKYIYGKGTDPIGTVESLISRLVTWKFKIPSAHAPIYNPEYPRKIVDPRVAAEEIGFTYIPCVLLGLSKAPLIVMKNEFNLNSIISIDDVKVVITPKSSLGGIPVLSALKRNIPVISIKENLTNIDINSIKLKVKGIIEVNNYFESIGMLVAIKEGINLKVIKRPLNPIQEI